MSFADNVVRLRKEKGYSQAELARKLEVSQASLAQYGKGIKIPNIINAVKLAQLLGTTCEELVK